MVLKYSPSTSSTDLQNLCTKLKIPINLIGYKDEVPNTLTDGAYIINLHDSTEISDVNHWTCFWKHGKYVLYFDSYGVIYPVDTIHNKYKIIYNKKKYQGIQEGGCGWYCIAFLNFAKNIPTSDYTLINKLIKKLSTFTI